MRQTFQLRFHSRAELDRALAEVLQDEYVDFCAVDEPALTLRFRTRAAPGDSSGGPTPFHLRPSYLGPLRRT